MAKQKDIYDQFMVLGVTSSAANTLTFSQVSLGISLFDYAALVLSRIEYYLDGATILADLVTSSDILYGAITGSDDLTVLEITSPEVYDMVQVGMTVQGAAGSGNLHISPIVHDFSGHPGGGLLVPAQNVYIGVKTSGFAGAAVLKARVYYRVQELQAADFIELVQRLRVLSSF